MSVVSGPNIVTSGLIFDMDMSNIKSSVGAPATNLIPYSQDYSNNGNFMANWTGNLFGNWINSTVTTGYQAPDGTYTANLITGYYSRWTPSITATTSTTYTFSVWLKNYALANPPLLHVAFGLNGGLVNYNNITTVPIAGIGDWTRYSVTVTSPSSGINQVQCGVEFGASKANSSGPYAVAVWGAQLETGSYPTTYIPCLGSATSRSSTQALLDSVNKTSVVTTTAAYASDGTFSFNGAGTTYINVARADLNGGAWAYPNVTACAWIWIDPTSSAGENNVATVENAWEYKWINNNNGTAQAWYASNPWAWYGPGTVPTGQWFMYTFRHGASIGDLWANNSQVFTQAISGTVTVGTASYPMLTLMGRTGGSGSPAKGKLGAFHLYNRALTDAEIIQNFNATRSRYGV